MELTQVAETAKRLTEAFEASQTSEGSRLVGTGDRPPVPQDLADQFRALMERPASETASTGEPPAGAVSEASWRLDKEPRPLTGASDLAADAPQKAGAAGEAALPSPVELYQIQFELNMSHFTTKFFSTFQEQAASQFEQTLKSRS